MCLCECVCVFNVSMGTTDVMLLGARVAGSFEIPDVDAKQSGPLQEQYTLLTFKSFL